MKTPTIHTNGTGRADLLAKAEAASRAVCDAIDALIELAPNGRDFYPQGPDAIKTATAEWGVLVDRLKSVVDEVQAYWIAIDEA